MRPSEMAAGNGDGRSRSIRMKESWRAGDRSQAARLLIGLLVIVATLTFIASIMIGAADASLGNLFRWLTGTETA